MKIALCLSGQARFLEACYYESMKPNIIDDLNPDVYEKVNIEKIDSGKDEVIATLLMKHFFEDLGLPQRFSFVHIKKIIEENRTIFKSQSIKSHRPEGMPEDAELMSIQDLTCICDIF